MYHDKMISVIIMRIFKADEMLNPNENISITKNKVKIAELPHTHEFIELVYIFSGSGRQCVNGISYNVSKGDLLFINYNQSGGS
jgi:mannose-6-phosphate isomerase-like protein (cupin superfamily)